MRYSLDKRQQKELVDALFACKTMKEWSSRETVIQNLPDEIKFNISRHPDEKSDVFNIVAACYNHSDGLKTLVTIIRYYEGKSAAMKRVDKIWSEISDPMISIFEAIFVIGALWGLLVYFAVVTDSFYMEPFDIVMFLFPTILAVGGVIGILVVGFFRVRRDIISQIELKEEEDTEDLQNQEELEKISQ